MINAQNRFLRFSNPVGWGLAFGLLGAVLWLAAATVYGQSLSLSLTPPLLEITIQPGRSITQVYKISNQGETDLALTSQIVPFQPADEFGHILPVGTTSKFKIQNWFSFQNTNLDLGQKFLLPAGQKQEIVLKLKIPENTPEGDYYAALFFATLPEVFLGGQSATQAQAKIGSNLLITVSRDGQPLKKAKITEFRLQKCLFRLPLPVGKEKKWCLIDSFDQPEFLLRLQNTGRAFFKPMGRLTVTGWLSQKYLLELLPENVLVDSLRQIRCQFDNQPGSCRLNSRFLLGPYQAKVEFGPDRVSVDYTATTSFLALPFKLSLGLIVIIAIIRLIMVKIGT